MQQLKASKRIIAWVAAVATVLVMLFSVLFISENTMHHCHGHECPICQEMDQCLNNIKKLGAALVVAAVSIMVFAQPRESLSEGLAELICNSLISQKVRLNN